MLSRRLVGMYTHIYFIYTHPSFLPLFLLFFPSVQKMQTHTHTHTHTHTTVAVLAYPRDFPSRSQHGNVFLLSLSLRKVSSVFRFCSFFMFFE